MNNEQKAQSLPSASLEQNGMLSAALLLKPRYEVIGDAPLLTNKIGDVITCSHPSGRIECNFLFAGTVNVSPDSYPLIFRKMNWWEKRTAEEMPKKVKSLADNKGDVFEIEEWDMEILVGWINKKERSCCSLLTFKPEYGYVPISSCRVCGCEIKNNIGDELCAECWSRGF